MADILITQKRRIGTIYPQVTISERMHDELAMTDNPVDSGEVVTDHSYKLPAELTMRCGWSESGSLFNDIDSLQIASTPNEAYQNLLSLQKSRLPFTVTTPRRQYSNMLIRSLDVTTDAATANVLMVEVVMREVIIVSTQQTTMAAAEDQASPQDTAATTNGGVKQATVVTDTSVLSKIGTGVESAFSAITGG
ncbi:phage baseplate protein [Frateuria aurantia]|uniref:phage baseplate protein n=1 Tax=Frateuria aurantia TaxID=81475 RepID=UPI0003130D50|nr:hypothetical protein [Frateuria aurantia]